MKLALLLLGSAMISGGVHARDKNAVRVSIVCHSDGSLKSMTANGKVIPDPVSPLGIRALELALPDHRRAILLTNDASTPYRCIGELFYTLQRRGYKKISFISEPSPAAPTDPR